MSGTRGRLLRACGLRKDDDGPLGAQTERRVGAGPAGGLLGGKDPTGRFSFGPVGWLCKPSYFSFNFHSSTASARKRRKSASFGACLSIHPTARSYHSRACSFSPRRRWAIARKNHWAASPPFGLSCKAHDFSSASMLSFQFPAR